MAEEETTTQPVPIEEIEEQERQREFELAQEPPPEVIEEGGVEELVPQPLTEPADVVPQEETAIATDAPIEQVEEQERQREFLASHQPKFEESPVEPLPSTPTIEQVEAFERQREYFTPVNIRYVATEDGTQEQIIIKTADGQEVIDAPKGSINIVDIRDVEQTPELREQFYLLPGLKAIPKQQFNDLQQNDEELADALAKFGISGYDRVINQRIQNFERDNIQTAAGEWINRDDWAKLQQDNPELARVLWEQGISGYDKTVSEMQEKAAAQYELLYGSTKIEQFLKDFEAAGGDPAILSNPNELRKFAKANNLDLKALESPDISRRQAELPDVSFGQFYANFKAERPDQEGLTTFVAATTRYQELFGNKELEKAIGVEAASLLFPPAKALKPEYTLKDVTPIEWGIGAAQLVLIGAPVIGAGARALGGANAARLATGTAMLGAGGVFTYDTVQNWEEMSPVERALMVALDTLIIGGAVRTIGTAPLRASANAAVQTSKNVITDISNIGRQVGLSIRQSTRLESIINNVMERALKVEGITQNAMVGNVVREARAANIPITQALRNQITNIINKARQTQTAQIQRIVAKALDEVEVKPIKKTITPQDAARVDQIQRDLAVKTNNPDLAFTYNQKLKIANTPQNQIKVLVNNISSRVSNISRQRINNLVNNALESVEVKPLKRPLTPAEQSLIDEAQRTLRNMTDIDISLTPKQRVNLVNLGKTKLNNLISTIGNKISRQSTLQIQKLVSKALNESGVKPLRRALTPEETAAINKIQRDLAVKTGNKDLVFSQAQRRSLAQVTAAQRNIIVNSVTRRYIAWKQNILSKALDEVSVKPLKRALTPEETETIVKIQKELAVKTGNTDLVFTNKQRINLAQMTAAQRERFISRIIKSYNRWKQDIVRNALDRVEVKSIKRPITPEERLKINQINSYAKTLTGLELTPIQKQTLAQLSRTKLDRLLNSIKTQFNQGVRQATKDVGITKKLEEWPVGMQEVSASYTKGGPGDVRFVKGDVSKTLPLDYADQMLKAVSEGRKPIVSAIFDEITLKQMASKYKNLKVETVTTKFGGKDTLVYQDNFNGRLARNRLIQSTNMPVDTELQAILKHIELGKAYGYTNDDIAYFLRDVFGPSKIRELVPNWYRAVSGVDLEASINNLTNAMTSDNPLLVKQAARELEIAARKIEDDLIRRGIVRRAQLMQGNPENYIRIRRGGQFVSPKTLDEASGALDGNKKYLDDINDAIKRKKKAGKSATDLEKAKTELERQIETKTKEYQEKLKTQVKTKVQEKTWEDTYREWLANRFRETPTTRALTVRETALTTKGGRVAPRRIPRPAPPIPQREPLRVGASGISGIRVTQTPAELPIEIRKRETPAIPGLSPIETTAERLNRMQKQELEDQLSNYTEFLQTLGLDNQTINDLSNELENDVIQALQQEQAQLTETELETQLKTETVTPQDIEVDELTEEGTKPPFKFDLPDGQKTGTRTKLPDGSITWQQGFQRYYITPPYTQRKPLALPKGSIPIGATRLVGTPQETLEIIGTSESRVPQSISLDMGVTDVYITDYGKRITFFGKGEETDVGLGIDSTTVGMSVPAVPARRRSVKRTPKRRNATPPTVMRGLL